MSIQTYRGSCHCGAVRFEADLDLDAGTVRCNCSLCTKARAWFALAKPEQVRLLEGVGEHATYRWTPPGRDRAALTYQFCRTCGVRTFGRSDEGPNGRFVFVNVAALDVAGGADADALARSIHYVDGRHDRTDRRPDDVRTM
jgi:hypothetical protein